MLATFLLTIFRDLTEGILVGFALGAVLFINRMAEMTGIENDTPLVTADRADDGDGDRVPYDAQLVVRFRETIAPAVADIKGHAAKLDAATDDPVPG